MKMIRLLLRWRWPRARRRRAGGRKGARQPRQARPLLRGLKGKKVVFVPLAMGFDLTEGGPRSCAGRPRISATASKFATRTGARTRARAPSPTRSPRSRISLIVHNPDLQSYAKLEQRAVQAGIKVLQVNLETVNPDRRLRRRGLGEGWPDRGAGAGRALRQGIGKSGKVAILEGQPTAASNLYELYAYYHVFADHPEIQVVADQAATYDPAKARAITETVLQQHPDLCGIVGNWDNQDVGAGAAVQAAGKSGQVFIVTSGGGNKTGCDNISKGLLSEIVSYDVPLQGDALNQAIVELLLSPAKAGRARRPISRRSRCRRRTRSRRVKCWTLDELK